MPARCPAQGLAFSPRFRMCGGGIRIGDDGFLRRLKVSVRRPNIFGDLSWCRAKIADKRVEESAHLVDLEVWVENQFGEVTANGVAVVELPSRGQAVK